MHVLFITFISGYGSVKNIEIVSYLTNFPSSIYTLRRFVKHN